MAESAAGEQSLLQPWLALAKELPGLLSDRVELLTLELQRVGRALAQVVALVVAIAVLGVTAWLLLWGGAVALLVQAGWPPLLAVLLALAVNAVAIVFALRRLRRLVPLLSLPATRRHLSLSPSPVPRKPVPPDAHDAAIPTPTATDTGQPAPR